MKGGVAFLEQCVEITETSLGRKEELEVQFTVFKSNMCVYETV